MNVSGERPFTDPEGPLDAADDLVLRQLAAFYEEFDPAPADLVERLTATIAIDGLDAELAELQVLAAEPSYARSTEPAEVRTLTFAATTVTMMISIGPAGPERVRIDGWAAADGTVSIQLHQGASTMRATADDTGRFSFPEVPHGITRFLMHVAGDDTTPPVLTPGIEL